MGIVNYEKQIRETKEQIKTLNNLIDDLNKKISKGLILCNMFETIGGNYLEYKEYIGMKKHIYALNDELDKCRYFLALNQIRLKLLNEKLCESYDNRSWYECNLNPEDDFRILLTIESNGMIHGTKIC